MSDAAVAEVTGRSWTEWEAALDEWGGAKLSHKELVALVRDRGKVGSGWWQQSVVVGYEKLKGRRITGQTADGGFQIGVQRTVDADLESAWAWLVSRDGVETWLGIDRDVKLEEGKRYRARGEGEGEVRVVRPRDRLRLTWKPEGWERASTIQVRVEPKDGGRTVVGFHEENLPSRQVREARRKHFKHALDRLEGVLG